MTISLNWLKKYIDIPLPPQEISELLTSLGLEVEGMEETESIKGGLEGVVVGYVKETWKHPNADKLTLTKVDVGNGEPLQIVCGAPNVTAGQKVLVATAGTTLYPIEGEPIKLKKGNIRGEASEGMICAEDELGIGTDHNGILVLPPDTPIGLTGREYFKVEKDVIFEIGLTPNRSDATCHLGVAKDLAAALKVQLGKSGEVKVPSVENFKVDNHSLPVEVVVENTEACPRYAGVSIKGITVGESPDWLKKQLVSIGVRPISNIVDITNFILHELGQPLHAFDMDEIAGRKVIVKTLPEGTIFQSLDEQERKLNAEDLMICDGDSKGMCIGGVFGGMPSGVKDSTKNIFLESAHFNAKWIRSSSTRHDLRTDAARVFEKGSDPNLCVYALQRAAMMMVELAGGEIASDVVDIYPNPIQPAQIEVSYEYVNRLIGTDIPHGDICKILEALGMTITPLPPSRGESPVPISSSNTSYDGSGTLPPSRGESPVPIPSSNTSYDGSGTLPPSRGESPVPIPSSNTSYDGSGTLPPSRGESPVPMGNALSPLEGGRGVMVAVPTNKADVTRPADVVEEILRVYGLDNVPVPAQIRSSMVRSEQPEPNQVRNAIGDFLAANGFYEIMALSLSQSSYYKNILPKEESELVFVNNTSNVHLDIMRPTMLFSGLEAIVNNQNRQQTDLKLFEFGKTYHRKSGDARHQMPDEKQTDGTKNYEEPQHLTLFLTGQRWQESWRNKDKPEADFFTLKSFADNVLARLGISGYQETAEKGEVFAYSMKYHRGLQTLVTFGKVQPKICKKTGIRSSVFYADLDWDILLQMQKRQAITFAELNKFPTVRRDLAVVIENSVKFNDLAALSKKVGKKLLKDINLFDVYENEAQLGKGKISCALSFTFEDPTRTLQDKEVDAVMNELIAEYESKLGAVVRR